MTLEDTIEAIVRRVVREEISAAVRPAAQHVTIAAYADARSISESTVRAAIREGRLPSTRIGRAVRVPAAMEIADSSNGERKNADARAARVDRLLGIGGRS